MLSSFVSAGAYVFVGLHLIRACRNLSISLTSTGVCPDIAAVTGTVLTN